MKSARHVFFWRSPIRKFHYFLLMSPSPGRCFRSSVFFTVVLTLFLVGFLFISILLVRLQTFISIYFYSSHVPVSVSLLSFSIMVPSVFTCSFFFVIFPWVIFFVALLMYLILSPILSFIDSLHSLLFGPLYQATLWSLIFLFFTYFISS